MIPGVNPRQLKQMMRQMGMSQEDLNAKEVIIKTEDKVYIFKNPQVQKVVMQGQETFQVSGDFSLEELELKVIISDEDIEVVSEQAGISKDEARIALENCDGDIAEAIVSLTED